MFCRTLRNLGSSRWALVWLLCLALVGAAAASTRVFSGDDWAGSISLRAPEVPLAALATTSSVRFEKNGQAIRLTFHKPERSAQLSSTERSCGALSRLIACHAFPLLPRRFLRPRHVTPHAPSDAGDPLLASLSLS